jgi:hypothetical protein
LTAFWLRAGSRCQSTVNSIPERRADVSRTQNVAGAIKNRRSRVIVDPDASAAA